MNDATNSIDVWGDGPGIRLWWTRSFLAVLVIGLALFTVACSSILPGSGAPNNHQPSNSSGNPPSGSRSTNGGITVAFAECMRSHGVPNFPNPTGNGPDLGPGSGVDPTSPQFQHALQACKSLAPPAWMSSGPTSVSP